MEEQRGGRSETIVPGIITTGDKIIFLDSVAVIPIWPGLPFCWGQTIFICHEWGACSGKALCWHGPCEGDPLGKSAVSALMELIQQK